MSELSPDARSVRASIAVNESWARTADRAARTSAARSVRWQRYLDLARELAPDGATDEEIERRAGYLRQADMKRMSLASKRAREAKKAEAVNDDDAA